MLSHDPGPRAQDRRSTTCSTRSRIAVYAAVPGVGLDSWLPRNIDKPRKDRVDLSPESDMSDHCASPASRGLIMTSTAYLSWHCRDRRSSSVLSAIACHRLQDRTGPCTGRCNSRDAAVSRGNPSVGHSLRYQLRTWWPLYPGQNPRELSRRSERNTRSQAA